MACCIQFWTRVKHTCILYLAVTGYMYKQYEIIVTAGGHMTMFACIVLVFSGHVHVGINTLISLEQKNTFFTFQHFGSFKTPPCCFTARIIF